MKIKINCKLMSSYHQFSHENTPRKSTSLYSNFVADELLSDTETGLLLE